MQEIELLEAQLREAKKVSRELSTATAAESTRKGRLEEFFLLCMHDFKQAAARQRHVEAAAAAAATVAPSALATAHGSSMRTTRQAASSPASLGKVLQVMAESDELHMLLYEKLFPHRQAYFKNYEPAPPFTLNDRSHSSSATAASELLWEPTCELSGFGASLEFLPTPQPQAEAQPQAQPQPGPALLSPPAQLQSSGPAPSGPGPGPGPGLALGPGPAAPVGPRLGPARRLIGAC